jgi:hypothetical protein
MNDPPGHAGAIVRGGALGVRETATEGNMAKKTIPEQAVRTATGPLKLRDDWSGVFIPGDEALGYAGKLRVLLVGAEKRADELCGDEIAAWMRVEQLVALLESCRPGMPADGASAAVPIR